MLDPRYDEQENREGMEGETQTTETADTTGFVLRDTPQEGDAETVDNEETAATVQVEAESEAEETNADTYRYYQFEENHNEDYEEKKEDKEKKSGFQKAIRCVGAGLLIGAVAFGTMYGLVETTGVFDKYQTSSEPVIKATTTVSAGEDSVSPTGATTVYDVSAVVESVMPSVVAITNTGTTEVQTFFGMQSYDSQSSGSGIIVGENDSELLIATNNHVVSGANNLAITFDDETTVEGVIKGSSNEMDLAVVAVNKADLSDETKSKIRVATIGDSDALKVGEPAIAIGNALGYGQSTTCGIISALNREVTVQTDESYGYGNSKTITNQLIQTDAAINPGNSGGALLNIKGELIGINSVKYSSEEVEGMGYAIPISAAQPILDELMNRETRTRIEDETKVGYLGIQGADVTTEAVQIYGMPAGAFVVRVVDDSAADKAGLMKGDVITKFDGNSISSMEGLSDLLYYYKAGEEVDVVVARNNGGEYEEETITVTLDSRANMEE